MMIADPFCVNITARYTEFRYRGGSDSMRSSSCAFRCPSSTSASARTRVILVREASASARTVPRITSTTTAAQSQVTMPAPRCRTPGAPT